LKHDVLANKTNTTEAQRDVAATNQDHRDTKITARRAATKNLDRNHRDTEIAEVTEKNRAERIFAPREEIAG
jgi:hypothetical protein